MDDPVPVSEHWEFDAVAACPGVTLPAVPDPASLVKLREFCWAL
jgi:hypothetical protein